MTAPGAASSPVDRPRTVFLGTGSFAVPVLAVLVQDPVVDVVAVVTAPPRADGTAARRARRRSSPVGEEAARHGRLVLTPARLRSRESVAEIRELRPDLIVLADYGRIVPPELLELPAHGALNLHPSLLPRHRGATPIPAAILAGDAETGVSLIRMDAGVDTGPLIAQQRARLTGDETAPALRTRLAALAARILVETLPGWLAGALQAVPQPSEGASVTRPLRREDGRLDPTRPAAALERQVRAYQPWPGSFLETDGERIVVWRAEVAAASHAPPGMLVPEGRGVALATPEGSLRLLEVQLAGSRRMTADELVRGRPALVGSLVAPPARRPPQRSR